MQFRNFKFLICLTLFVGIFTAPCEGFSQSQIRTQGPSIRSQVAKILLSSLGGAVLGISSLSFYDRPQDHLSNVALGGTLGAVLGSIYVTKESLEMDSLSSLEEGGEFQLVMTPQNKGCLAQWSFSF
ncbi:MAG: hypothetical protein RJB66_2424 [Pseudomonadota bacterium]|jgi:hypothetical protein